MSFVRRATTTGRLFYLTDYDMKRNKSRAKSITGGKTILKERFQY